MVDNPYPAWRRQRCRYCDEGMAMALYSRHHWTSKGHSPACTAPSAENYIAELQAALEASGNVTAEMLARMTEQSEVLAEALRERDEAKKCAERRKSTLRHTGKKAREAYWQLREKLASVEEDSAMLDWIIEDIAARTISRTVYISNYDEVAGHHTYSCCGKRADSPKAAIRAAMEAGK